MRDVSYLKFRAKQYLWQSFEWSTQEQVAYELGNMFTEAWYNGSPPLYETENENFGLSTSANPNLHFIEYYLAGSYSIGMVGSVYSLDFIPGQGRVYIYGPSDGCGPKQAWLPG